MPKYSIITPQYNSFGLMERYFDSLMGQTYKDFEVIIVDDCSTDGSFEKLKDYVEESPLPITLLQSQSNAGPGNARNIGIDNARGEWITFVDNDDWVVSDLLERIDVLVEREKVNCIIYDYFTWREGKTEVARSMYIDEGGEKSLSDCVISIRNHSVGKFYRLSKCRNIHYPLLRKCEDVAYVCQAVVACGSAYYYNEPLYYYWQRPTSLSNNKKLDEGDLLKAFGILEETVGKWFPDELKEKSVCDILYGAVLIMCKAGKSNETVRNYIDEYERKYPVWWECKIIGHLGKAKKVFLFCVRTRMVRALKVIAYAHSRMIG